MKQATSIYEIDQALRLSVPVPPEHEFFTNLSDIRGDFEEKFVYRSLNVRLRDGVRYYDHSVNNNNETLLFIGGMRGTGKSTELLKYFSVLDSPKCFYGIYCSLDIELNTNDMEYVDILILQFQQLSLRLRKDKINISTDLLKTMHSWFSEQLSEVNFKIGKSIDLSLGGKVETPSIFASLIKLFGSLKANVMAGSERTEIVRNVLRQNFNPLRDQFNEFVKEASQAIREKGFGQDILFIIDGLEKTNTQSIRRKIIIDEGSRLRQVRANCIFVLPVELMKERQKLRQMTEFVTTFPNIRIIGDDQLPIEKAYERLTTLITKRISKNLFDPKCSTLILNKIIEYSGGNPRELLRILSYANLYSDEEKGYITMRAVDTGLKKLSNETTQFISNKEWDTIILLEQNNIVGINSPYNDEMDTLVEKSIIYDYSDGAERRVNPIVKISAYFKSKFNDQG
jgi:hypothetical protein